MSTKEVNPDLTPVEYQDSMTGGLYAVKGKLMNAVTDVDRLIERSVAATAKIEKVSTPVSGTKLGLVLLVSGIVSLVVGMGYQKEEEYMAVAVKSKYVPDARDFLMKGDYKHALASYQKMYENGECVEEALFRIAECQFRLGKVEDALVTVAKLEIVNRKSDTAPMVRGWVAQSKGNKILAKHWYDVASSLGNEKTSILAGGVN